MTCAHPEEFWTEKGITFSIIPPTKFNEIVKFLDLNFYPDEPMSRSIDLVSNKSLIGRYVRQEALYKPVKASLAQPTSWMALDSNGEILGVRLGEYETREKALEGQFRPKTIKKLSRPVSYIWDTESNNYY